MLRCSRILGIGALTLVVGLVETASAQFPSMPSMPAAPNYSKPRGSARRSYAPPPAVSPYLNLLRPDSDLGANYLTLVHPQIQQLNLNNQQSLQNRTFQQQLNTATKTGAPNTAGSIRPTGVGASRMNYSHYYQFASP